MTVTTNHLERQWKELDKIVRSYQNDEYISQYIDQYHYFKNWNFANLRPGERFGNFLYDISMAFPGPDKKAFNPGEPLIFYQEPRND